MINIIENSSLQDISIDDIDRFLQSSGWKRRIYPDRHLILYDGPEDDKGRPIVLTLPTSKDFRDSLELIGTAINLLSVMERISPQQIIQKIRAYTRDTIYMRILLEQGSMPSLDTTSHIIRGLRNLVAYSACMEREIRTYFEHPFGEGKQQAKHFLFGHTFQGSFGFTLESPIEGSTSLWSQSSEPLWPQPLERRVVERITRGLLLLRRAVQAKDAKIISENYKQGLNANMCTALADIFTGVQNTEVEFSISWSPQLTPSADLVEASAIRLPANVSSYLEEAAQYLEAVYRADEGNIIQEAVIDGDIQELISKSRTNRTVTVLSDKYGDVLITLVPESEWDRMACNAYRDRHPISIKGTLIRRKKGPWMLNHPYDFKV